MQDFADLYSNRYDETTAKRVIRKIQQEIQSNKPPMIMLATIIFLATAFRK